MGKNLKTKRIESGMSQSELAKATGINIRSIQAYEIGDRDINKAQAISVYKIAMVLKCDVKDILELEKDVVSQ